MSCYSRQVWHIHGDEQKKRQKKQLETWKQVRPEDGKRFKDQKTEKSSLKKSSKKFWP